MDFSVLEPHLFRNAQLYAPEDLGHCDLLIAGGKIVAVEKAGHATTRPDCPESDLAGAVVCPGFIDQHVHLIGGGGEAGPHTRTPEVRLSALVAAGITSVVGLLGTDGVTRHPESLLAKTRALEHEGISTWMLPTHVNRAQALFHAALDYAREGGYIDITTSISEPVDAATAIATAREAQVPFNRLTLSSDGNGSQPNFDANGNLVGIGVAGFESLLETLQQLVGRYHLPLEEALLPFTRNVAEFLGLEHKGRIAPGCDADVLVLTDDLKIREVWAKGRQMVSGGVVCVKGTFE
ncbi:beta-aspartyl-peptidase [Enterobacter hormaechei]|uniref:amidohydrolase family protein n=1 Tax=Enterobacter hormaechei TaxID=158836 RepID=UPI00137415EC|nr:amidohydrolase family protein [Enterobacter hormaechei]QHO79904.1 beta-aspartyl-peptidase [Enterobacter hormaechei]QHO97001.1 beta-aspartyl-peptidase [Enterobacter hormaechei]CAE7576712.1 Isoaspartyl dipeptidase [Enterobacter cloacae]CAH3484937.1 Isoaspartyl dipeptidase [Enterobacter cloacae]